MMESAVSMLERMSGWQSDQADTVDHHDDAAVTVTLTSAPCGDFQEDHCHLGFTIQQHQQQQQPAAQQQQHNQWMQQQLDTLQDLICLGKATILTLKLRSNRIAGVLEQLNSSTMLHCIAATTMITAAVS